jgi:hypothetical protein
MQSVNWDNNMAQTSDNNYSFVLVHRTYITHTFRSRLLPFFVHCTIQQVSVLLLFSNSICGTNFFLPPSGPIIYRVQFERTPLRHAIFIPHTNNYALISV